MSRMLRRNALVSASGLCPLALLLALVPNPATAATHTVTNCDDDGSPGSLRYVMDVALDGDTIDLSQLACNRILLANYIHVPQNNLTLIGRSRYALTIEGNLEDRVFNHVGSGTLRLERISIANGREDGFANGGCIYSQGSVELFRSRVHHCETEGNGGGIYAGVRVLLSRSSASANVAVDPDTPSTRGRGGAVWAPEVVLSRSQVHGNRATEGGGIYGGRVSATYSVIRGNQASAAGGIFAGCLGSFESCTLTLVKSTVSSNQANFGGGFEALIADRTEIIGSTVSNNIGADFSAGGLSAETRIFNSTIALNQETGEECLGAINAPVTSLLLVSSIVSRNICTLGGDKDIASYGPGPIMGSNNIIGVSDVPVPPDTITARPLLGPLTDNGGPTPTRMPRADSPAIDRGSNPLELLHDQRGPGFPRVNGIAADIGAVER